MLCVAQLKTAGLSPRSVPSCLDSGLARAVRLYTATMTTTKIVQHSAAATCWPCRTRVPCQSHTIAPGKLYSQRVQCIPSAYPRKGLAHVQVR